MTYTITENPGYNSLEITFTEKPEQAVRDALKALRFRWHRVKKVWYGYARREAVEAALAGHAAIANSGADTAAPAASPAEKNSKPMPIKSPDLLKKYRDILEREVWPNSERMVSFCMNKVAELVELPNGDFITIEKKSIEKHFCFGYSDSAYDTEDYDRANRMAHHAATSEEYFFDENMKDFRGTLKDLDDVMNGNSNYMLLLRTAYYGQSENSPLKSLQFVRVGEILEALGGSAYLEQLPGTTVTMGDGRPAYICTGEDLAAIRAGYERAMTSHEKKVRQYLKRYGLSKVETWSYWRDE